MCSERETSVCDEAHEARIVLIRVLVQASGEQVLTVVVHELLLIRQIAVACVEALWQEQQVPDAVPVFRELTGVGELILVTLDRKSVV